MDTCAIDSFSRVYQFAADTATGKDSARFSSFLTAAPQFVFQPHGHISDSSSWVFTNSEKGELLGNTAYTQFMSSLSQTKHLLIIGFNPNEFSFSYLIQNALGTKKNTGSKHYIILPDADPSFIKKYGDMGYAIIPYRPKDPDSHSEIKEMLEDIFAFIPKDDVPGSVYAGKATDLSNLPSDDILVGQPVDKTRQLLNGAIASIIPPMSNPQPDDLDKLEKFYREHLRAIHMAWLIHPHSDCDEVHGYKILSEKGRGAFGQVYEAERIGTKERVALKVLLPEVRHNRDYINSFRRGVRSMRILTQRDVKKMVKFVEAYEIPACVFMEYIEGPTLTEAKEWKLLDSISDCLDVLVQVGEVVQNAHNLEERVLHRDLKPDNVILRDYYTKDNIIDVVVLDFDLSWHKGDLELSVVHGARAQGYAAPEQTASGLKENISTRHTAVDVFGYGMLAYFLLMGEDPRPNEQNFTDFERKLKDGINKKYSFKWQCLSSFLTETIIGCTIDQQGDRIPFSTAIENFRKALIMTTKNEVEAINPILLREMATTLEPYGKTEILDFGRLVKVTCQDPSKRISLKLTNDRDKIYIAIELSKVRTEGEQRNIAKYLENAKNKAISKINCLPFESVRGDIGRSMLTISVNWPLNEKVSLEEIKQVCKKIVEARYEMQLS